MKKRKNTTDLNGQLTLDNKVDLIGFRKPIKNQRSKSYQSNPKLSGNKRGEKRYFPGMKNG